MRVSLVGDNYLIETKCRKVAEVIDKGSVHSPDTVYACLLRSGLAAEARGTGVRGPGARGGEWWWHGVDIYCLFVYFIVFVSSHFYFAFSLLEK